MSFKSNVSTATTTLDTWLGLSERAKQKQAAYDRAQDATRQLYLQEYMNTVPRCNKRHCPHTHTGAHFTPLIPFNCPHKRDQAFQSLSKRFNSTQITLASAQLAKYTVVHLVSFGLRYSSQPPSWSTTDASIAVKFFHIKVFRSYPKHFTAASNVCVCVCLFLRKIEGAEEGCRKQSICMQLHKGTV